MRPKARVVRSTVEAEYQAVNNNNTEQVMSNESLDPDMAVPDMTGPYIQSAQVPSLADMDGDTDPPLDPNFEEGINATPSSEGGT